MNNDLSLLIKSYGSPPSSNQFGCLCKLNYHLLLGCQLASTNKIFHILKESGEEHCLSVSTSSLHCLGCSVTSYRDTEAYLACNATRLCISGHVQFHNGGMFDMF